MITIAVLQSTSQMKGRKEMIVPNAPKIIDNMIESITPPITSIKNLSIFAVRFSNITVSP